MSSLVTRPSYIRQRLAEEEIHPSKAMGQNFLADGNIMELIVDAAGIQPEDHVIEIGPGLGALTVSLLREAGQVTCIEKDKKLADLLDQEFATRTQAELFTAMDSNLVGTTMTWAERAASSAR